MMFGAQARDGPFLGQTQPKWKQEVVVDVNSNKKFGTVGRKENIAALLFGCFKRTANSERYCMKKGSGLTRIQVTMSH